MTMISDKYIKDKILPSIKEEGRMLDYYLVKGLVENSDKEIINELKKFQNKDFGFGHGLEPDLRMPYSSVSCTNHAVHILSYIQDKSLTKTLRKQIVEYYESVYIEELGRWRMTTKQVNDYPRAIWWNFETVDNFTYGNPNPEIIGFLYENREFLLKIDIKKELNKMIDYVENKFLEEASMHSVLSLLHLYNKVDENTRGRIKSNLQKAIDNELNGSYGKWSTYGLEPYKVAIINIEFLESRIEELKENLLYNQELLSIGLIVPNWEWYQFNDVFESCKMDWSGHLTLSVLRALRLKNRF